MKFSIGGKSRTVAHHNKVTVAHRQAVAKQVEREIALQPKVDALKRKISNEHKSRRTKVIVQLTRPGKRGLRMYRAKPGEIPRAAKVSGLAKSTIEYRLRRAKELRKVAGRHRFKDASPTKRLYVTPRPPRRRRKDKGKPRLKSEVRGGYALRPRNAVRTYTSSSGQATSYIGV